MIIEVAEEDNVTQIGDIKNNSVSIDTNNIDFIVTLLSTSLYSKPIESFIRETVSNAWDSHTEAGTSDPVILELGKNSEGDKFCRVQDFGVGLSPERFNDIYRNIGSSTKRGDNKQIGGFGIGRFSALAYSDVVHITTNFDGIKYLYMMYKDGNSVSIDMLHSLPTTERNGLEVKVKIKDGDFHKFETAIKQQLVYFENLYIEDTTETYYDAESSIQHKYNTFSIKKYNSFWVNTLDVSQEVTLVLGKVRYPLRIDSLSKVYPRRVHDYPISLVFDIGEIEVTPNREEISYTEKNIAKIVEKLDAAVEEIDNIILAETHKDYNKISDYLHALNEPEYVTLYEKPDRHIRIKVSDTKKKLTLKGHRLDPKNFKAMYETILKLPLFTSQYMMTNNFSIQYKQVTHSINDIKENYDNMFFCDISVLSNMGKRYIREKFKTTAYFIKPNVSHSEYLKVAISEVQKICSQNSKDRYNSYGYSLDLIEFDRTAFRLIYESLVGNLVNIQQFRDKVIPKQWILDTREDDKLKRGLIKKQGFDWKQEVNIHTLRDREYGGSVTTDSKAYTMKGLSTSFKKLTIYGEKDDDKLRTLYTYMGSSVDVKFIELAPTKVKLLKDIENFVYIEDLMDTKYSIIRNIATARLIMKEIPELTQVANIVQLAGISSDLYLNGQKMYEFVQKYKSREAHYRNQIQEELLIRQIEELCADKNYYNEEYRGLLTKYKADLNAATFLIPFTRESYGSLLKNIDSSKINLLVDYILARKLFRPDLKAVIKAKKETIYNIIPEEDEIN